ncbi:hypothetical protein, conserved [Eimeria maxima]|uniref:Uncharacterized protein n=1 Tax=Eimeria maxima TaxID=5804 RepID=U6M015_EIMMA|nr:hypothetical protein, conserved [Eimeria maxima]CDJ57356.1 hypothetical protein, conserved [Eimeria maxima]
MVTAEAQRVLPILPMDECVERRFGFLLNAFSRATIYAYLGPLLLGASVVTVTFRRRQTPPEGEAIPSY